MSVCRLLGLHNVPGSSRLLTSPASVMSQFCTRVCVSCRRRCFVQDHRYTRSWQTQRYTDKWESTIDNLAKSEVRTQLIEELIGYRRNSGHRARPAEEVILHIVCRCSAAYKTPQNPENTNIRKQNRQCFHRARNFHRELSTLDGFRVCVLAGTHYSVS